MWFLDDVLESGRAVAKWLNLVKWSAVPRQRKFLEVLDTDATIQHIKEASKSQLGIERIASA
jgi:hypothetical protein